MANTFLMKLQLDRVALWAAVVCLSVLSFVTTSAARDAGTAAQRAEVAVVASERNQDVLDAIQMTNEAGEERATAAAQSVVTYIRCIALIPEPAESRGELRAQLDDCAVQASLEPGPRPGITTTTTTTRSTP